MEDAISSSKRFVNFVRFVKLVWFVKLVRFVKRRTVYLPAKGL